MNTRSLFLFETRLIYIIRVFALKNTPLINIRQSNSFRIRFHLCLVLILIIIQLNPYKNMNQPLASSPIYFAYTYTANRKVDQDDDNRSVVSSCHTSNSRWSAFQSLGSTQRLNQLKPKSKIVISKCSTLANTKKKSQTEVASPTKFSIHSMPPSRRSQTVITESIEYSNIKPFFNWSKFTFLCGMNTEKLGDNGCLCGQRCPWKREWTKGYEKHDLRAYQKLLKERPSEENKIQIQKDLARTHPQCPTFSQNMQFRQMLKKVLIAYSIYDIQMGYVQGVNMIAGVLLYHIKNDSLAFWALVQMMEYQQLRMVYLHNFQQLKVHCQNITDILMSKVNDLFNHMRQLGIMIECFLNGWLLSLMSTSIPMEYMHEVIDKFRKKGWRYMYQLIVTYLLYLKEFLLTCNDEAEFLMNLNTQSSRQLGIEWAEMIQTASKLTI